jgi:hypothetical protein
VHSTLTQKCGDHVFVPLHVVVFVAEYERCILTVHMSEYTAELHLKIAQNVCVIVIYSQSCNTGSETLGYLDSVSTASSVYLEAYQSFISRDLCSSALCLRLCFACAFACESACSVPVSYYLAHALIAF